MTWEPAGNYAIKSDCGRYTISKARMGGETCLYRAWHGSTPLGGAVRTADEAKAIVERHRSAG